MAEQPARDVTFKAFIKAARQTQSIAGDLVGDMKHDRRLPETFGSLARLQGYLALCRACPEVRRVAPQVWRRYQAWRLRNPEAAGSSS